jgi:hypothetical protein
MLLRRHQCPIDVVSRRLVGTNPGALESQPGLAGSVRLAGRTGRVRRGRAPTLHRTVRAGRGAGLPAVAGNEIGVYAWAGR